MQKVRLLHWQRHIRRAGLNLSSLIDCGVLRLNNYFEHLRPIRVAPLVRETELIGDVGDPGVSVVHFALEPVLDLVDKVRGYFEEVLVLIDADGAASRRLTKANDIILSVD